MPASLPQPCKLLSRQFLYTAQKGAALKTQTKKTKTCIPNALYTCEKDAPKA